MLSADARMFTIVQCEYDCVEETKKDSSGRLCRRIWGVKVLYEFDHD